MEDSGELSSEAEHSLLEYLSYHNCAEPSLAESPWPVQRWWDYDSGAFAFSISLDHMSLSTVIKNQRSYAEHVGTQI